MTGNEIAKMLDAAVKVHRLGFGPNFGAEPTEDVMEWVVRGLSEENLGVLASLRKTSQVSPECKDCSGPGACTQRAEINC